jgi:hypothetical protein
MPSKIDYIIPESKFEKVRDLIAAILLSEFENQVALINANDLEEDEPTFKWEYEIFKERITPIHQSEEIVINLLLSQSGYPNQNRIDTEGKVLYFIDIYTNGKETSSKSGDLDSSEKLHTMIRWVRHILAYSDYKLLNTKPGIIAGTSVDSFEILPPSLEENSTFARMARIFFTVRMNERQDINIGDLILSSKTKVKLDLTNKGYKYKLELEN